jgi:ectoine hydroxylase
MFELTPERRQQYEDDGYVVFRGVFGEEITRPLLDAVGESALAVLDRHGNKQEVNTWTWCGDDLIGRFPRVDPLVDLAEFLIDDDVYHWHSKISWKRPHTAGTWDWHQDYAFWVEEGCAQPAMTTISVALDDNNLDNGCLHVVKGSHHLGVIDHVATGHGRAADQAAVDQASQDLETVAVELEPGDMIAFHSNTLHTSGPNESDRPRTLLHCSYNSTSNAATAPLIDGHQLNELTRVPLADLRPNAYDSVFGETVFIGPDDTGYSGRSGYTVLAADS